jgi:homoserine kinase
MNTDTRINIHVPATTANLGPGFDCLGLALDLWNHIRVETGDPAAPGLRYRANGEGADTLNQSTDNLLTRSFMRLYEVCGQKIPQSLGIYAENNIPLSSGLGSSAAAIVAGLAAANRLLAHPLNEAALLELGSEIEGHSDNVAPALMGGLVVSTCCGPEIISRRFDLPPLTLVIIQPEVDLPTKVARSVLPDSVSRDDAIFNIGRAVLVTEALRSGDLHLLAQVMEDKIHQPYRLRHIPGGEAAYLAAKSCGAVALSGAGPSLVAFVEPANAQKVKGLMMAAFGEAGIGSRAFITHPSPRGVHSDG